MSDLSKRLDYLESLGYQFNGALWSDRITVHSPGDPTWSQRALFRHMPWGWYLSDKCWDGCP